MSRFTCELGDGLDLVLREPWTVQPMHHLIVANLDRLRAWEPWAHDEQTVEGLNAFTQFQLEEWAHGRNLPTALRFHGQLIGAVGARIDPYAGTADLGYWIDADHEGAEPSLVLWRPSRISCSPTMASVASKFEHPP